MKKGLCELVFILDRSGSMSGLEADTVGGFNSLLKKQREKEGECLVTTVLFSSSSEILYDRCNISEIKEMTVKDFTVGGMTALLDAVGETIERISLIHRYARQEDVPEKTIFVISTDGAENSSRSFSENSIKALIELKRKEDWEFIFLGANIDAVKTASSMGISEDRAAQYYCDGEGTEINFCCVDAAISSMRASDGARVDGAWKKRIEDYRRKKK